MEKKKWGSVVQVLIVMAAVIVVGLIVSTSVAQEQNLTNPIVQPDIDKFALTGLAWRLRPNGNIRSLDATYVLGYVDGNGDFQVLDTGELSFTGPQVIANTTQGERDAMVSIRNKVIAAIDAQVNP